MMDDLVVHVTIGNSWEGLHQYYGSLCGISCASYSSKHCGVHFDYIDDPKDDRFDTSLISCTACSLLYMAKKAEEVCQSQSSQQSPRTGRS